MNLEQIKNEIFYFLKSNENYFSKDLTLDIAFIYDSIYKDINESENKDYKMAADPKKIEEIIFGLSKFILDSPINIKTSNFIMNFCEIIFNWNNIIYKNNKLPIIVLMLNRLIEMMISMKDSIKVMKDLAERNKDLGGWDPPVFEVAKEYFEQLLKKHESEEIVSNEETRCSATE